MSDSTVRHAVADWLQPPSVTGLNEVFAGPPWFADGADWNLASELGWGAIGFVELENSQEFRIAVPAIGNPTGFVGQKMVTHDVAVVCLFQWLIPQTDDVTLDPAGYADARDALLWGIRDRIRSSPTLGTEAGPSGESPTVFQAGQGDGAGGPDLTIFREVPTRDIGKIWSWNAIRFKASEIISA